MMAQRPSSRAQKTDSDHSVYYVDPGFYYRGGFSLGGGGDKGVLQRMSSETGGHVYEVHRNINNVSE